MKFLLLNQPNSIEHSSSNQSIDCHLNPPFSNFNLQVPLCRHVYTNWIVLHTYRRIHTRTIEIRKTRIAELTVNYRDSSKIQDVRFSGQFVEWSYLINPGERSARGAFRTWLSQAWRVSNNVVVPDDVVALFVARLFNYPVPVSQRLVKPHFVLTILRMQTRMIFLFLNVVRARFLLFIDVSRFVANLLCWWIITLTRSLEYIFSKIFSSYHFATLLTSFAFRCSFPLPC